MITSYYISLNKKKHDLALLKLRLKGSGLVSPD
jgi:hypothetical protein